MRRDSSVLLLIRVTAMSGTSAVHETVCLCEQLSFIDCACTVSQAEWWCCLVHVALTMPLLEVTQSAYAEDAGRPWACQPHFSAPASDQTEIVDLRKHNTCFHCVFSRFEREWGGASSQSDHWPADRSPESPQPSAAIHSGAAPALPASPVQKLPQRSDRVHGVRTAICSLKWWLSYIQKCLQSKR